MGICHSYTPDDRCVSLLKILLTNYCVYDCKFCVNRISSDTRRARFTPEEIILLTLDLRRENSTLRGGISRKTTGLSVQKIDACGFDG
jgi:predicted DNA-binding helix-hairpin-helix protein